jgi:menaquinone-dependent protoporphyrinogen oxidase
MDKILLVYGSGEGQTAKIARRITAIFQEKGYEVDLIRGDEIMWDFSIKGYSGILVASSIHMGKHQKYIVKFVKKYRAELQRQPSAFISVSISATAVIPKLQNLAIAYYNNFVKETGWEPKKHALIGGGLQYSKYKLLNKYMMRRVTRLSIGPTDIKRDYEYTDWEKVEQFANEFLESLKGVAVPVR